MNALVALRHLEKAASLAVLLLVAANPGQAQPNLADLLDNEGGGAPATSPADQAAVAQDESGRLAVPSASTVAVSRKKVQDIFGADLRAARTTDEKAGVANQILGHAAGTDAADDKYAMLLVAIEAAVDAGDLGIVMQAIDLIADNYQVSRVKVEAQALQTFVADAPVSALGEAAETICSFSKKCLAAGQIDAAKQWASLAVNAAKRAKDRDQQKVAVDLLNEVRDREKAAAAVRPLVDRLKAAPDDRDAAAELGKFRCFEEGDWASGLPLLARGSDAELASIAKLELTPVATPAGRVKLGDAWWSYAEKHKGDAALASESRAREHYATALPDLAGLDKVRVEKRLGEAAAIRAGAEKRPKSLVLWLDASMPGAVRGPNGQPYDRARGEMMPVGAWSDLHARVTCAVGPGARPPVVAATAFNGLPGVMFSGEERLLANFSMPRAGSIAVVLQVAEWQDMRLLGCMEQDPGIRLAVRPDGGMWLEYAKNFQGGPIAQAPKGAVPIGKPMIVTGFWSDSVGLRLNGSQFVSPANPAPDVSIGKALVLGAMTEQGTYSFKGILGEVRIYNEVLAPPAFAMLETELRRKWSGRK